MHAQIIQKLGLIHATSRMNDAGDFGAWDYSVNSCVGDCDLGNGK